MTFLIRTTASCGILAACALLTARAYQPSVDSAGAPPTPPAIELLPPQPEGSSKLRALSGPPYQIGDPTPEEQLYVELINRARADAVAEGLLMLNTADRAVLSAYSQFGVDLEMMENEFALIPPAPPLAINPRLTEAARLHSLDMFQNVFQGHTGTGNTSPGQRATAAGYSWMMVGENVYARAKSVFHGHAGFQVDWGPGPGGMQEGRGHRAAIHNPGFRELGVGVVLGTAEKEGTNPVGPQLVTQVFGTAQGATPFITGVAYYDLNGNSFYDPGEGIGGVMVEAEGAGSAVSARSGGFSLPVPGNGTYNITLSGPGFASEVREVTVSSGQNVKIDFKPPYTPPQILGPAAPAAGRENQYSISEVGGAAEYEWISFQRQTPQLEGAENGTANVVINQTPGYNVIQSEVKASGSFAFHLAHPEPVRPQIIELSPTYLARTGSRVQFQSQLGWAAPDQTARVEVSEDDGLNWEAVYSQAGTGARAESTFITRSADLSAYAGKPIRIRFVYDWQGGSYFPDTDPVLGWLIDDIRLLEADLVANAETATSQENQFVFTPSSLGEHLLLARARTGHAFLPWGSLLTVQAVEGTDLPAFQIASSQRVGNNLELEIEVLSGSLEAGDLIVESTSALDQPWVSAGATVQPGLRVVLPIGASGHAFFRIRTQ